MTLDLTERDRTVIVVIDPYIVLGRIEQRKTIGVSFPNVSG